MKVFLAHPMKNLEDREILKLRGQMMDIAKIALDRDDLEVVDSWFQDEWAKQRYSEPSCYIPHRSVMFLGKAIQAMAEADMVIALDTCYNEFAYGTEFEISIARRYDIPVMSLNYHLFPWLEEKIIEWNNTRFGSADTCAIPDTEVVE